MPLISTTSNIASTTCLGSSRRNRYQRRVNIEPLELMKSFMLICVDHFPHKSLGGSRYFITFTDDFSRKSWIYFLATKSQAFEKFKFFKELVEKNEGKSIKMLRTDRGGELLSNAFNAFCDLYKI
jgi:hypothetical protein